MQQNLEPIAHLLEVDHATAIFVDESESLFDPSHQHRFRLCSKFASSQISYQTRLHLMYRTTPLQVPSQEGT